MNRIALLILVLIIGVSSILSAQVVVYVNIPIDTVEAAGGQFPPQVNITNNTIDDISDNLTVTLGLLNGDKELLLDSSVTVAAYGSLNTSIPIVVTRCDLGGKWSIRATFSDEQGTAEFEKEPFGCAIATNFPEFDYMLSSDQTVVDSFSIENSGSSASSFIITESADWLKFSTTHFLVGQMMAWCLFPMN